MCNAHSMATSRRLLTAAREPASESLPHDPPEVSLKVACAAVFFRTRLGCYFVHIRNSNAMADLDAIFDYYLETGFNYVGSKSLNVRDDADATKEMLHDKLEDSITFAAAAIFSRTNGSRSLV